jgi:hypothetical protein
MAASRMGSFLVDLYPELLTTGVGAEVVSNEPFEADWPRLREVRFKVWTYVPDAARGITVAGYVSGGDIVRGFRSKVIMTGTFRFDDQGQVLEFQGRESFALNSGKHSDLRGLIESHPEWTAAQALQALKEARPLYGPGEQEALMKVVPWTVLERRLGKLTVQSVQFDTMLRAEKILETPAVVFYQWHVVVQGQRPGQAAVNYVLHFEPFGGKLTEITSDSR